MTQTEHLQLYHWAPEDFVNLDQINANFMALDQIGGEVRSAAGTLRYLLAHDAMQRLHTGTLAVRYRNLIAADFTRQEGQTQTLYHLQNVDGMPVLIPAIASDCTISDVDGHVQFCKEADVCTFVPDGYGQLTSVSIPAANAASPGVRVSIVENGHVLAVSDTIPMSEGQTATFSLSCDVAAGHTYAIRIYQGGSGSGTDGWRASGSYAVTFGGTVYPEGYFTTRGFALTSGTELALWVYHTGGAPAVAYSLDGGDWQPLTAAEHGSGMDSDANACRFLRFALPAPGAGTLRLRFTLSDTATRVRECCGILL